jgi:hypothetical protein
MFCNSIRFAVYNELMVTESKYIDDLKVLIKIYLIPLREAFSLHPIISRDDVSKIFSNIEGILDVNSILLKKLEEGRKSQSLSYLIASSFIEMESYFRMYFMYCNGYYDAVERVKELESSDRRFQSFTKAASLLPEANNLDLGSFLIKPVQRICKYPLLLREILKNMEVTHVNYEIMMDAEERSKVVAAEVNERMRDRQRASEVVRVYRELEGEANDLVTPTRRLVLGTELIMSTIGNTEKKLRQVYLFNDLVIIVNTKKGVLFSNKHRIKYRFDLRSVENVSDHPSGYFSVKVSSDIMLDKFFFFPDPENPDHANMSKIWMSTIESACQIESSKNRRLSSMEEEESKVKPKRNSWTALMKARGREEEHDYIKRIEFLYGK